MTEAIERPDDERLAAYRHVGDPHWLRARGLFVAEGRLVVLRLIEQRYAVESVLLTPAASDAMGPLNVACPVYVAPQSVLDTVTGFNFHRGCLAIARRPRQRPLDAFASMKRIVVLEGVGNPDNVGGIFRSAGALGADAVILDAASGDPLYRKAVRTSMAASLRLPFATVDDLPRTLSALGAMGFRIAALTPAGRVTVDEFASDAAANAKLALLAGAEGPGLTQAAVDAADVTVRIPIDARSDSLNVVVAVSIALQRLHR